MLTIIIWFITVMISRSEISYYPDSQNYLVGIFVSLLVYDQSGERLCYRESEMGSATSA
ncbi:MAG: hypothetical protein RR034_03000 [Bacteroidales bacterium]